MTSAKLNSCTFEVVKLLVTYSFLLLSASVPTKVFSFELHGTYTQTNVDTTWSSSPRMAIVRSLYFHQDTHGMIVQDVGPRKITVSVVLAGMTISFVYGNKTVNYPILDPTLPSRRSPFRLNSKVFFSDNWMWIQNRGSGLISRAYVSPVFFGMTTGGMNSLLEIYHHSPHTALFQARGPILQQINDLYSLNRGALSDFVNTSQTAMNIVSGITFLDH